MKLSKLYNILNINILLILCVVVSLLCGSRKSFAVASSKTPSVVELTGKTGASINARLLLNVCKQNGIPLSSVYQWKNHLVIYGNLPDTVKLLKQIKARYPACSIKSYSRPFYNFNRKYCNNQTEAKDWENIILTANLVADPKMQQEYLQYHATQFQKWPEVSNGFCHANFQQLLVFENGRQLMLVISIPKGESLDKLNPKTTENNPRVDEWNAMMKKYQTGIPGTKKNEVWVFFKPVG
ncbi:L-rhamnose mutarotase [Mucilaginibacter paludis]|uniref:L-rhamnose mutarotase n=1 Tax=Mucilaginibacter paludis DSM 18603 TaxID=714943 RepID=H1YEN6_9SPHI|nr:L-rhamnose mutarotase [Mucilaginibacter paludis]EHQ30796.1 hypothetical protein Mucpa_6747 [Mucilaginibacter paludis DSM 18603]